MKNNFFVFSLKKHLIPCLFYLFTICLVLFSNSNLIAAKNGITLWANSVLPALLPFFIATELLNYTNIVSVLGKYLNKFMRPLFNVPGEGAYAFIMGIISGYPMGAKIVSKLKEDGNCTLAESERLLAFTNNSGPLFIIGTVGVSLLGDTSTGLLLFFTHLLACLSVAFIFRFWKAKQNHYRNALQFIGKNSSIIKKETVSFSNLGEILSNSIINALNTVIMIGGFVVLFSVITSILNQCHIISGISSLLYNLFNIPVNFSNSIITGIVELTNGLKSLCSIHSRNLSNIVVLCAFLLGFGGISVMLQVLSITSKAGISIKPYFIGKCLQGIFAAFYTHLILNTTKLFNLDLAPVSSSLSNPLFKFPINLNILGWFFVFVSILIIFIKSTKKHFM